MSTDCIFCQIVRDEVPCHRIWEDEKHLAFLSIFPNTEGFTVVIPKEHHQSYVFDLPESVMQDLMFASKQVAKRLDAFFVDVGRTGLMFEGFGVNHMHAKLFPMHGTAGEGWKQHASNNKDLYFDVYQGYTSSHDGHRAGDTKLTELAKALRGE